MVGGIVVNRGLRVLLLTCVGTTMAIGQNAPTRVAKRQQSRGDLALCTQLTVIDSSWQSYRMEWLELPLPRHIVWSVERGGGMGFDDEIFGVPPLGYSRALIVILDSEAAPRTYHLFAFWDSTTNHPVVAAVARSRDLAGVRAFIAAFRRARVRTAVVSNQ